MAFLTPDQLDDFVSATLAKFDRLAWTDISLSNQDHIAMSKLLDKAKVGYKGGTKLSWRVMVGTTGNARNSGLYDVDQTAVSDVLRTATTPWRFQTTNFSYDVMEEEFQSDRETIIEELKVRELDAMNDMATLMEANFWNSPSSTSDNRPNGLPYWIVKNATTGFNGGNPSGHTDGAGGIDSATYTNWRNYTAQYVAISQTDLLDKWRTAMDFTHFKAPHPHKDLNTGDKYCNYTTHAVKLALRQIQRNQNDNLGSDVEGGQGEVTFSSAPVVWVPYLSSGGDGADSSNPIYGVNWGVFKPFFKTGLHMRRHKPKQAAHQRNVREVHIDNCMNYTCKDRRRNFVLYTA